MKREPAFFRVGLSFKQGRRNMLRKVLDTEKPRGTPWQSTTLPSIEWSFIIQFLETI